MIQHWGRRRVCKHLRGDLLLADITNAPKRPKSNVAAGQSHAGLNFRSPHPFPLLPLSPDKLRSQLLAPLGFLAKKDRTNQFRRRVPCSSTSYAPACLELEREALALTGAQFSKSDRERWGRSGPWNKVGATATEAAAAHTSEGRFGLSSHGPHC